MRWKWLVLVVIFGGCATGRIEAMCRSSRDCPEGQGCVRGRCVFSDVDEARDADQLIPDAAPNWPDARRPDGGGFADVLLQDVGGRPLDAFSDVVSPSRDARPSFDAFMARDAWSPSCSNGRRDPGESDIDCGGICPPCPNGYMCTRPTDGASGFCGGGHCMVIAPSPTCSDGMRNGSETDIDCGGSCPPCADGRRCSSNSDCSSSNCSGGICRSCAVTSPSWRLVEQNCTGSLFLYSIALASPTRLELRMYGNGIM
ncbi:MAG: hypothetical protein RMJ84_00335 [Sandaracinaceae bacterium]|nr:hypothetical protein [Sandaracinaceae bacterium]